MTAKETIQQGKAILGIEFGSTRIKAVLVDQENNPIDETLWLLSEDVLTRWQREKDGETEVGRVLPPDYLWFSGDGYHNYFRNAYRGGNTWDWEYESPYES